jgi:hypothetical protein
MKVELAYCVFGWEHSRAYKTALEHLISEIGMVSFLCKLGLNIEAKYSVNANLDVAVKVFHRHG